MCPENAVRACFSTPKSHNRDRWDFGDDGAKSHENPQTEGVLGSEIAARNRKSLAIFHRTLNRP